MAVMNDLVLEALLEFLFWWGLFTAGYASVIFTLDWLFCAWQEHRVARQKRRRVRESIKAEMRACVGRLTAEFLAAQRAMRSVSMQEVDRR